MHDGFLDPDLPDLPNGVRERLKGRQRGGGDDLVDGRGDGMWTRGSTEDDTPDDIVFLLHNKSMELLKLIDLHGNREWKQSLITIIILARKKLM
jgi:hypothetical protein